MKKKSIITLLCLLIFFILLIPLEVFVENKADTINTQLILQQAAGTADYTDLMTTKTQLRLAVNIINSLKILCGVLMIIYGTIFFRKSDSEKIESKLNGEDNE